MSELKPGHKVGAFVLDKNVGAGAFAQVWLAHHGISKQNVAIKVIVKESVSSPTARTRLQREIALLKQMDHPFISELFQVIDTDANYYLVMEFVANGNLLDYVNNNGRLSEDQARRYFAQMLSVLEYLHYERKVAHRDIKCENVLLDRYNNIRVIDFGLSNVFTDENPQLKTACGSPAYAAPEMVKGNKYTNAADIWSTGVMLFAIVGGYLPFDDDNIQRLLQKIVYTEVRYPSFFSPQLTDLLQKMMCKDPERRLTLEMIKNHPWFSQAEYAVLLETSNFERRGDGAEVAIDREVIDTIAGLGIDCHDLHSSLLKGEFTELTALYRIFLRERATEKMKDLMHKMQTSGASRVARPPTALRPLAFKPADGTPPSPGRAPFPVAPAGGGGPRVLATPVAAHAGNRRSSRPVAVRRNVPGAADAGGGSHETP
jgi:serine/threonine protein kinase